MVGAGIDTHTGERIIDVQDPRVDLGTMAMLWLSLPRPIDRVDAIAVLPGLGEDWRIKDAVQAWNENNDTQHLFIAGTNRKETTWQEFSADTLSQPPYNARNPENVHGQVEATNTRHQASWLVDRLAEEKVASVGLFVSPYHLLRASLTVLKTQIKSGNPSVAIVPMPVAVSPATLVPEMGVNAWAMAPAEQKGIVELQAKGLVATREELELYLDWLWRQPVLNNGRKAPYHRQLLHDVVSELQALRDTEFVPEADIDTVWVFSGHGTYDQEGDLKPYEGASFDRLNFDAGVRAVYEITAKRLGLHVDLITKEDIEEYGPTLFYNGADAETPNVHYIQNEAVQKAMEDPDFPLPISKVVIGRIADNNTPAQMEGFGLHMQSQEAEGQPVPQKIAVVSSFAHRARIGRYLERFKYTFPEGTKFVNGPMPREPEHVNRMPVAMKEARAVLYYYDAGHLALRSALVPRPEAVTEVPRNLRTRLKSMISQSTSALRSVTSRWSFGS